MNNTVKWTVLDVDVSDRTLSQCSLSPSKSDTVAALASEILALRDVVRELVRNDGFYGGAPCWMKGSLADDACNRALSPDRSHDDA